MTTFSTTHADLLWNTPPGFDVHKHTTFDDSGLVLVWAGACQGVAVQPDQQLNVDTDDEGTVVAYSVGPVGQAQPEPTAEPEPTPEPEPDDDDDEAPADDEPVDSWPVERDNGWWELSNGKKVRGEEPALEAQAALDEEAER